MNYVIISLLLFLCWTDLKIQNTLVTEILVEYQYFDNLC